MSEVVDFLLERITEDENFGLAWGIELEAMNIRKRWVDDCWAKRQIVLGCDEVFDDNMEREDMNSDEIRLAQAVLAALALPYAEHPCYRQKWKR